MDLERRLPDSPHFTRRHAEGGLRFTLPFRLFAVAWRLPLLAFLALLACAVTKADELPLHAQIDRLVADGPGGAPALLADDAEFLRRVSLHLTGMPPRPDELRGFLAETEPGKRRDAVDRLLASPQATRRLAEFFDLMLMERRANTNIGQDEWMTYLVQSMRVGKPWNQLTREILSADGTDDDPRAAARFYLDRGSEPNLLTRDVGRIFLGRDMQCAQCHDHPLVDDYLQLDYHGLLAFFSPGYELKIKEGDKERVFYGERAGADAQFESVFVKGTRHLTGPRVPGGVEVTEPVFLPGDEYETPPADNVRPVPKFSRRARFAELVTSGESRAFNENIANRLWALMMGRGLVHPVDLHHSSNPPSHPALLALLGEQFAAMNFDVRAFLRELALTQVYQRSLDLPPDLLAEANEAAAAIAALEQQREPLAAASEAATAAFNAAVEQWNAAQAALLPAVAELDAARSKYIDLRKKVDDARKAAADAEAQAAAKQAVAGTVREAADKAQAAAAALPQDQELASAAQKFAERATQLAAEVETLKQAAAEKQAAIAAPEAEMEAARPGVEMAQEKVNPLREATRTQEQAMLAARVEMTSRITAVQAHDERILAARRLADVAARNTEAIAAADAVRVKTEELAAVTARRVDHVALVESRTAARQQAEQALAAAAQVLSDIEQEHARRAETAQSVATAAAAAETALAKLPDDATLKQAADSLKGRAAELLAAVDAHQTNVDAARSAHETQSRVVNEAAAALAAAQQEQQRLEGLVATAQEAVGSAQAAAEAANAAVEEATSLLATQWSRGFRVADLQPLSPEELCWSIFRVTGVYDRYWQAQAAELQQAQPLSEADAQDPAKRAARQDEIEQRVYDQLKSNLAQFASVYGGGAGQPQTDFFATADQALFAANAGSIMSWVAPTGGNVTERLINEGDPQRAAEDLYMTVLSRMPTAAEVADVAGYFTARADDRASAARELVWGLIASAEFRFNH